jgi:hypothetical protein
MIELYFIIGLTCCLLCFFYAAFANHKDSIFDIDGTSMGTIELLVKMGILSIFTWPIFAIFAVMAVITTSIKRINRNRHPEKKD